MQLKFPVTVIAAVAMPSLLVLGLTALPAAASPAAKPKVHSFTVPAVTGIKSWGTYYDAGGKAHITLCLKETARDVDVAYAAATATNASLSGHKDLTITFAGGSGQHSCRTMVTKYTAHLLVEAASGATDGKTHMGKFKQVY